MLEQKDSCPAVTCYILPKECLDETCDGVGPVSCDNNVCDCNKYLRPVECNPVTTTVQPKSTTVQPKSTTVQPKYSTVQPFRKFSCDQNKTKCQCSIVDRKCKSSQVCVAGKCINGNYEFWPYSTKLILKIPRNFVNNDEISVF